MLPQGYFTQSGYMGLTVNGWMLFASDSDYYEYISNN